MTRRPLARTTVLALVVLPALAAAACSGDDRSGPTTAPASSTPPPTSTVEVGALLDLSGPGATLGTATEQALRAAVTTAAGDGVRVELDVRDTGGDPAAAERELTALHDEAGLHVVIGPQTSAEAAQVLPYANANDILLVSPASTASTLAVGGDALYRMVPTDRVEGAATADLMTAEGPVTVVTASRDDPGNTGLAQAVGDAVVARGGSVVTGPVYPADASAPTAAPDAVARQIADAVADAAGEVEPVVYLAGFGEVAGILAAAADLTELQDTRFFGGDGSARSAAVIEDAAAAAFAAGDAAGFPSPLPALGDDAAEPPAALADAVPNADPLALGSVRRAAHRHQGARRGRGRCRGAGPALRLRHGRVRVPGCVRRGAARRRRRPLLHGVRLLERVCGVGLRRLDRDRDVDAAGRALRPRNGLLDGVHLRRLTGRRAGRAGSFGRQGRRQG